MSEGLTVRTEVKPPYPMTRREYVFVLQRMLEILGYSGRSVELSVTDDARIAVLNHHFMHVPGPTNVLSFPEEGSFKQDSFLGSICLSADTVRRESFLYSQEPREYAVRLLAHAILHLAGYDHGAVMDELTAEVTSLVTQELERWHEPS